MPKNQYFLGGLRPPEPPTRALPWTQWGPKAAPIPPAHVFWTWWANGPSSPFSRYIPVRIKRRLWENHVLKMRIKFQMGCYIYYCVRGTTVVGVWLGKWVLLCVHAPVTHVLVTQIIVILSDNSQIPNSEPIIIRVELSWVYWCFKSHATIFQSYMWRHRCAGGLKNLYLRSGSQRHRHFAGFFNVPVLHRSGTTLFIRWFRHTAPFSRL